MVKMIDSILHSSSLSRVIPLSAKRTKSMGTVFDIDDEMVEAPSSEKTASTPIQTPQRIQSLSLFSVSNNQDVQTKEIISQGNAMLDQLKTLQYHLLEGEVPPDQLKELETMFHTLPKELHSIPADLRAIVDDIQVRVAVELAKLSVNR